MQGKERAARLHVREPMPFTYLFRKQVIKQGNSLTYHQMARMLVGHRQQKTMRTFRNRGRGQETRPLLAVRSPLSTPSLRGSLFNSIQRRHNNYQAQLSHTKLIEL